MNGFTLVELMLAILVSGLVMSAVVMVYTAQTKAYSQHDDVADIQQNLRGALAILPMEIRTAGCDPTESNEPRILTATRTLLQFTRDTNDDGDVGDVDENIAYQLSNDPDGDGIVGAAATPWNGTGALGRQTGGAGGFQPLADNIEAMEFNYILDNGNSTLNPANLQDIRSVQISLLARATNPSQDFLHAGTYTTASGAVWTPPQDRFRRRLVLATIQCRNLGY